MRKQFVQTTLEIMEKDPRVVLLLGDIGVYGFREAFERFPKRTFNIGILEQASVSLAAGLAIEGMIPIFHTIAPFMVERALEQLKVDFGYQKLGGNFVSVGASYDYAALGCTHHCPGDVQILKTIPGAEIYVPGHPKEFDEWFKIAYGNGKLNYFRLSEKSNLRARPNGLFRPGQKATVIAIGPMLDRTLEACEDLDVTISYHPKFEPFVWNNLCYPSCSKIVIVEPFYEGTTADSIRYMAQAGVKILSIGVPRHFLTHYGTVPEHDEKYGLTAPKIRETIKAFLNQ